MADTIRSPKELRNMFGANLRRLAQVYPSVAALCRQLGINRTQFNRYLSGESFPRPDVLDRICRFFEVDARILLKPLDDIDPQLSCPSAEVFENFLTSKAQPSLPPGFFWMTETHSSAKQEECSRLLFIRRVGQTTVLRGYESRQIMPGTPTYLRELQGIVCHANAQVCVLMSRRGGQDSRVMVVSEQLGESTSIWFGYTSYLSGTDDRPSVVRPTKLLFLGDNLSMAIKLSRASSKVSGHAERGHPKLDSVTDG
ncbi:helix-turn-helix domain-containing protein [Ruegeria arenilitoris]|uniref:helix-turn-helix domain-containing protein n=1 Tax=Ruegeria arenilitoris TaxID=1173585 RepID=UPI0020C3CA38|nr:helix-turn-helix transcriptional regulator [Ruegeria arenilitoris]